MGIDQERGIGIRGLNLSADPAQLAEGALTLADGVRYFEDGAAFSRGGRVQAGLDFPYEGASGGSTGLFVYQDQVSHFRATGRVRGCAPFYDQRIWPTDANGVSRGFPQRLNFLEKVGGSLYFNDDFAGSASGVIDGDGSFSSTTSRAKIVVYGDRAYIVDGYSTMKVFRRRPKASQTYLSRILYTAKNAGIKWPTAGSSDPADLVQKPTVTATAAAYGSPPVTFPTLAAATFRLRIVLEDEFGIQSSPSPFVAYTHVAGDTKTTLTVKWNTIFTQFPAEVQANPTKFKVRLYCQVTLTSSQAIEPGQYNYIKSSADASSATGATGLTYTVEDQLDAQNRGPMLLEASCPPILHDVCIVNDVAFGASGVDVIYREVPDGNQITTALHRYSTRAPNAYLVETKLTNKTKIAAINVDRSYLFIGNPGEPEYMHRWRQVGNGTEQIVGLSSLGKVCVVFTNQGIYTYDPEDDEMRTGYARVGCIARDTIVSTESGIRFIGTDGVPRLFNGATVDEVANELLPIFDRDDYVGDYERFDRKNSQEVVGTYGDRKFFMLFPVSSSSSLFVTGTEVDPYVPRYMAIGDASRGATRWSLDRGSGSATYESVYWLGRESRMLAIDSQGYHYFIEEGLLDEQVAFVNSLSPNFAISTRRFSAGGVQGQFFKVKLDVNTQNEVVNFYAQMDGVPGVEYNTEFSTVRRDEVVIDLPANFKGRYMDIRISGSVAARFALYGILPEVVTRGVF